MGVMLLAALIDDVKHGMKDGGVSLAMPLLMGIGGYFMIGFQVWGLVDEVYDCVDHLLVKNRGLEEAIPLSNIMNVSDGLITKFPRITLTLVEPSAFGKKITFSPAMEFSLNPFSRSTFLDELIVRVDRARSKRVLRTGT